MKGKKDVYCGLEHFMKNGCVGCKLSRKCEEYYDRFKRDRNNNKKLISEVRQNDNERLS